jgi:hypothetical protein
MTFDELVVQHKQLQADVAGLCRMVAAQQQALEQAHAVIDVHRKLLEAMSGYVPPHPGKASTN